MTIIKITTVLITANVECLIHVSHWRFIYISLANFHNNPIMSIISIWQKGKLRHRVFFFFLNVLLKIIQVSTGQRWAVNSRLLIPESAHLPSPISSCFHIHIYGNTYLLYIQWSCTCWPLPFSRRSIISSNCNGQMSIFFFSLFTNTSSSESKS